MEYLRNKKVTLEYKLEDTYECGLELLGTEVASVRHGQGSLNGAYVSVLGGELYLLGAHIPAWQEKNTDSTYDAYRSRKLLVHKKELLELMKASKTKGLTVVPISLYNKGRVIKLQVAIARGKKNIDKRETIKKRDLDREFARGSVI